jgi:hypothetical protein
MNTSSRNHLSPGRGRRRFSVGEQQTEAHAPFPDTFVTDDHAAGGQDQFDLSQAQAEAVIQPDRMLDDLGRKPEAAVRIGRGRHAE